ncbi:PREDICTED: uncharacterized protein LOC109159828 [Ipomoea nil]|uniref:uncharacterized protein LOC109159828 n=1 Tax=Ipomoea nil TaxID=35883 RepID=UPI000901B7DF|nr:PREDICTED: uncharacterized protein LOC109159828 [Ipomoea nil]
MEDRMRKLEATVIELNSKIDNGIQATQDSVTELSSQMNTQFASFRDEMINLLRLNRPAPPVMGHSPGQSSVQGRVPESSGGRPDKAPVQEPELEELDPETMASEGPQAEWIPRRRIVGGLRPGAGQNSDIYPRFKSEFPPFDYANPRQWVLRCEKFFVLSHIPRYDVINLLYVHLSGKVGLWFEGYIHGLREGFQWIDFAEAVCKRFGDSGVSLMEDFTAFKQWSGVDEYTDGYEGFKSLLLQAHPGLTENYFLENYIARLKQNLRCFVRTAKPNSLEDAIWLARQYEKGLKGSDGPKAPSWNSKPTQNPRTYSPNTNQSYPQNPNHKPPLQHQPTASKSPEVTQFRNQLREQKRCFRCFEPWQPGHKCSGPTFNIIEGLENNELPSLVEAEEDGTIPEEAEISLCAVVGGEGLNTIKLLGCIQRQPIVILVDSGSTHSFLDPQLLDHMRRQPEKAKALEVTVANGDKVISDSVCPNLSWQIQQESFTKDFRLLRLGGCDMVLGMDWVDLFAPIQLHTRPPGISFHKDGRKVFLKGLAKKVILKAATDKQLKKWHKEGVQGFLVQCCTVTTYNLPSKSATNITEPQPKFPELSSLLSEFQDLFQEPKTLPPKRALDHTITLIHGAKPVNVGPYRYSFDQKNTIEKMVDEMLAAGVVTPSSSCFASPVLLVPKKDSSWRFCIDYRALNNITVKNKFPIPLVEDLFSELSGANCFSKLDLRSGYHQVRMKEGEEFKTAFRTHQGLYEFKVMPFGLTNAPATFQALMNSVFKPLLRKFVLVFFDDILVYSPSWEVHWQHLREVLLTMRQHQLLAKMSKCSFAQTQVEYLGHIISQEGLQTDPTKLEAVAAWPRPKTVKALRGFLGLTGYYRRFIRAYGVLSKPLTEMLKNDGFKWGPKSDQAFEQLKSALCNSPVLALPNFQKDFIVEADASHKGMGAVLVQEGKPIAFFSKAFGEKHLGLSIYEKEYLSIINVVDRWRPYLLERHFAIKTDHHSLQFLLEQKITTALQQKGLSKLLGLDYSIQYKRGADNQVADALSRRDYDEGPVLNAISVVQPQWLEEVLNSYTGDTWASTNLTAALIDPTDTTITVTSGLLRYKGRLYIGSNGTLRKELMLKLHESAIGGHSGQTGTYQRMKALFYWKGLKRDVIELVRTCDTCQRCKHENVANPGLLQPLNIPEEAWQSISMDFIEGLPLSKQKNVILVVVDRLTKYAHFIAVSHPYTAEIIANLFMENIYRLHGLPRSIISDRDKVFTSRFWQALFKNMQVQLNLSTAYHPQTDGQTERVNQCLESYLRCMAFQKPASWGKWLHLAEWWYNTNYHSALKCTPFQALYGYTPPALVCNAIHKDDESSWLIERNAVLATLKENLKQAHNRMKVQADKGRSERILMVGDWVYLKVQPYRQVSLAVRSNLKLASKYYGPYKVIEKVGAVAYKLQLPAGAQLHPVFHVSQLKKRVGEGTVVQLDPPVLDKDGQLLTEPVAVLGKRLVERNNQAVTQLLVQWANLPDSAATWEDYYHLKSQFPSFDPWGQGSSSGGGDVTTLQAGPNGEDKEGKGREATNEKEKSSRVKDLLAHQGLLKTLKMEKPANLREADWRELKKQEATDVMLDEKVVRGAVVLGSADTRSGRGPGMGRVWHESRLGRFCVGAAWIPGGDMDLVWARCRRLKRETYSGLISKVQNKLTGWKMRSPSLAGRRTLGAISAYCHPCLYDVIHPSPNRDARKCNLVAWDTITQAKEHDGLEFGNSTWQPKHECSNTWKGILGATSTMLKGLRKYVKNGKSTLFWLDSWLGHRPLADPLHSHLPLLELRLCFIHDDNQEDAVGWVDENSDKFSIKTAYKLIMGDCEADDMHGWSAIYGNLRSLAEFKYFNGLQGMKD